MTRVNRTEAQPETPEALHENGGDTRAADQIPAGESARDQSTNGHEESIPREWRASVAQARERLDGIVNLEGEYDDGFLRPTTEARDRAWWLIEQAGQQLSIWDPSFAVGAVGDGGLTIQWGSREGYVRLLVPPDPDRAYLYCKVHGAGQVDTADSEALVRRLQQLRRG
jgi:hypothetical protein